MSYQREMILLEKYLPGSGLLITYDKTFRDVTFTEWYDVTGEFEDQDPEETVLRTSNCVGLKELIDLEAVHNKDQYSGSTGMIDKVIQCSLNYLSYWGGDESFVEGIGDD